MKTRRLAVGRRSIETEVFEARVETPADLEAHFNVRHQEAASALVAADPIIANWRARVYEWAERLRLPAAYAFRDSPKRAV